MNKKALFYQVKKNVFRLLIILVLSLSFISTWNVTTISKAEVSAGEQHPVHTAEEIREEITGTSHQNSGFRGLIDRLMSHTDLLPIITPIILVMLVIFLSFILVEVFIRKKNPKE